MRVSFYLFESDMSIIARSLLNDIEVNADNCSNLLKLSSEFLRKNFSFLNVTKVFGKVIVFAVYVNLFIDLYSFFKRYAQDTRLVLLCSKPHKFLIYG